MIGVTARVFDQGLKAGLTRVEKLGGRPEQLLKPIGLAMVQSTRQRFVRGSGPDGIAWPALNPKYAAAKKGPGILREMGMRGGLMGSITFVVDARRLEVGTNKIQARVHQFGAVIVPKSAPALVFFLGGEMVVAAKVTIPARPYLGIDAEDRAEIVEIAGDVVERLAGGR
jgi:phage virion morphogenesis protein